MDYFSPYAQPFFLEGGIKDKCILLLHGFTGSPGSVKPLADYLNKGGEGYNISCILLPGHGTHMDDLIGSDWRKWFVAAADEFRRLKSQYASVYVIGLSMGGNIALCMAANMDIERIVTISTPIIIRNKLSYIAEFGSLFVKYTYWWPHKDLPGELKPEFKTSYDGMPVRAVAEVRKITIASLRRLHRIKQPILIAQSIRDRAVHPKSPYLIYDLAHSNYKELLLLENSQHNAIYGSDRQKLFEAIDEFLNREIHEHDLSDKII